MNKYGTFILDVSSLILFVSIFLFNTEYNKFGVFFIIMSLLGAFVSLKLYTDTNLEDLGYHNFENIRSSDIKTLFPISALAVPYITGALKVSNINALFFIIVILIIIYFKSNLAIYNFLYLIFRYHYYDVTIKGKDYVLISKNKNVLTCEKMKIIRISSTVLLERK